MVPEDLTIADSGGNILAQSTACIQIEDIKNMYERWTVGDNPKNPPLTMVTNADDNLPGPVYQPFHYPPPETTNTPYILHVHGYRMPSWKKDRFAETEYKRLCWQGYQGRFGEFRWPTPPSFYLRSFDDSEYQAWNSGVGLLNLLTNLNAEYPGEVYLTAHSHGNVVAGEALRKATQQGVGQIVNTYVAMQGAIASFAYDPTTPLREPRLDDTESPDRYAQYYTNGAPCYFNGIGGAETFVNFLNTNDYALVQLWEPDEDLKPDAGYSYASFDDQFLDNFTYLYFPQDTYTIFSYCDEARSYALGRQLNVGGAFQSGGTFNQIELDQPPYNFGGQHIYHSGEFRSDYAQRWQFWDQVLTHMKLKSP